MTETMIFEEIYRDNEGKISDGLQVSGTDDGLKIMTAFEGQTDDLVIPWEDVLTAMRNAGVKGCVPAKEAPPGPSGRGGC